MGAVFGNAENEQDKKEAATTNVVVQQSGEPGLLLRDDFPALKVFGHLPFFFQNMSWSRYESSFGRYGIKMKTLNLD
jgi:hypothetical protein